MTEEALTLKSSLLVINKNNGLFYNLEPRKVAIIKLNNYYIIY